MSSDDYRKRMTNRGRAAVLIVSICLLLISSFLSCTAPPATVSAKKSIIVTYSILGAAVKELVGDQANVIVSIPNGLDPHEWDRPA